MIAPLLFAGLVLTAPWAAAQVGSDAGIKTEAPSFEVWCLEIQSFPAARCDERRSEDTETYEHYRALVEQSAQQRTAQDKRDQELMNQLNREPGDVNH